MAENVMSRVQVLKAFFFREGTDTSVSFLGEIKQLNPQEREELATLAAVQMNVTIKDSPVAQA